MRPDISSCEHHVPLVQELNDFDHHLDDLVILLARGAFELVAILGLSSSQLIVRRWKHLHGQGTTDVQMLDSGLEVQYFDGLRMQHTNAIEVAKP